MIKYASVIFSSEGLKEHILPIEVIFHDKKAQKNFHPKHAKDFEEKKNYYIWWSECQTESCSPANKCCKFYAGLIKSLGGKYLFYNILTRH